MFLMFCFSTVSNLKLRKFSGKVNGFWTNRSVISQIRTICRTIEGVHAKNLEATLLFVDFSKAFDSIHRRKVEPTLLAYGLPQKTVTVIMLFFRNTEVKVRSPDGDTDFFNIVAEIRQGDAFALYLFIISLGYVLRTLIYQIKENGFTLKKARIRRSYLPTPPLGQ